MSGLRPSSYRRLGGMEVDKRPVDLVGSGIYHGMISIMNGINRQHMEL